MATSYVDVLWSLLDDYGELASGAFIYTYEGGSTTPLVTYQDLRQAANLAMRETGMLEYKDETVSAVENDLIYTLPTGVFNVSRIEVATDIGTVDEAYQLNTHWDERDGKIYFDKYFQPATDDSQIIRYLYEKYPPDLTADADTISTQINEEHLVYLGARPGD